MRPETLQMASQIAMLLGIIITGLGGYGAYHFGNISDRHKDDDARQRETQLMQKIDGLDQGNKILQEKLKPFEQLANVKYPEMENDAALGRLYKELQEIRQQTALLDKRITSRRLVSEQAQKVVNSLKQHPSQTVTLTSVMGDTEAFQFATDIKKTLEEGGWKVEGVTQAVFSGPLKGILIEMGSNQPPQEVLWLFDALKAGGIISSGIINNQMPPNKFNLIIGSKK